MFHDVSPYELLRASKPQRTPTVVTPYDLYSRIQQSDQYAPAVQADAAQRGDAPSPAPAQPPQKRTHYIADIHAKHGAADRRVSYVHQPLH